MMNVAGVEKNWDMIVIGGGVTGAAIFREAVRAGLRVILIEQKDYAWGTSSRSSKMVHGGLRYLKEGKLRLTHASVRERQSLLAQAPGLVESLEFMMPVYDDGGPSMLMMGLGLGLYSFMAMQKQHIRYSAEDMAARIPALRTDHLSGGFYFRDAQVDDARLVLRLIQEGVYYGGTALNYTQATSILRDRAGRVAGITAEDTETGASAELRSFAVVNATGAWAEKLHPSPEKGRHIRPLRGSHLIFPGSVFPMKQVVSFVHPKDHRPVFIFPWEGTAVLGTTDVDHHKDLNLEPAITPEETAYLMEGLHHTLPGLKITENDCISSMAGIRPVLSRGGKDTSASGESRDHVVWDDRGLVTVTGGKLTTFRLIALDALKKAKNYLPLFAMPTRKTPVFDDPMPLSEPIKRLDNIVSRRLCGRYGKRANHVADMGDSNDLKPIPGTDTLWAEILYAARHEQVRHLSDLLLRRTRIGLFLPKGGADLFRHIQTLCQPALPWTDRRWNEERQAYTNEWNAFYAPPKRDGEQDDNAPNF